MFSVCSWVDVRRGVGLRAEFTVFKTLLPCLSKHMLTYSIMIVLCVKSCLLCLADIMDMITGPNEDFIPVLSSPVTPAEMTVEAPTISPALPPEGRTIPSINHPNTATSYGLEQLESEGILISDHIFEKQSSCKFMSLG